MGFYGEEDLVWRGKKSPERTGAPFTYRGKGQGK